MFWTVLNAFSEFSVSRVITDGLLDEMISYWKASALGY